MASPSTVDRLETDPIGVPRRVSRTGEIQRWPGNTVVCPLQKESPLWYALHAVRDTIQRHEKIAQKMHLLPPKSWHMTVLDGVNEEDRKPGHWPSGKEQQPLDDCTEDFLKRLSQLDLKSENLAPPYLLQISGINVESRGGMHLRVEAQNPDEEMRMRRLRDVLADTLGFRKPLHDSYQWHMGTCYFTQLLGDSEPEVRRLMADLEVVVKMKLQLDSLEFCDFETLHFFNPRLVLGRTSE